MKRKILATSGFVILLQWCFPGSAAACEPIVPLIQLFSGPSFVVDSLLGLAMIVGIKAVLFVLFERRLSWPQAALSIILANVVSTVIGVFLAIAAGLPMLILPFALVVLCFSWLPAQRLTTFNPWGRFKDSKPWLIATLVALLYLVTFFLFAASQGVLFHQGGSSPYWLVKLAYIYAGLGVSIFLTTAWEEAIVGRLVGNRVEVPYFLPTVLRANLYTLVLAFAYAAVQVIPRRLASPDYLISEFLHLIDVLQAAEFLA